MFAGHQAEGAAGRFMLLEGAPSTSFATEAAGGLLVEAGGGEVVGERAAGDGAAAACGLVGAVHCNRGSDQGARRYCFKGGV
jgi:hypothetical protein